MSVVDGYGAKVTLDRVGPDAFWRVVVKEYAGDERRWRYLAMLALRENAGWPLDRIGRAFGHPRGHVSRCLRKVRDELREEMDVEPSLLEEWEREEELVKAEG